MEYMLVEALKGGCPDDWHAYTHHEFVQQLAEARLPEASFRHFLIQDYQFLIHFSRAWALAAYKSSSLADMKAATEVLNGLLHHEMALHVEYCRGWGIAPEELERAEEARANLAYTRYVLETGMSGDLLDLLAALAPCVVGYAEIGARLSKAPETVLEGNPYRSWIETYAGEEFQGLAQSVVAQMDRLFAERGSAARTPALTRIFTQATRLEQSFWEMGLKRLQ
ncbi:thiaminase II [Arhodomonas sp. SL1]|uniref:thiaminase II n=1 Tax=Arhodomonas sp. SL1 TaxID=3425691 RepID=UPI003F885C6A